MVGTRSTWTGAPATGSVTGYRIDMSSDGFKWQTLVMDTENTHTSYSDESKLRADLPRHYRVYALSSHGAGRVSNPTSARTDPAEAPKAVTGLSANNMGQTEIHLSWTDPTDTGGLPITQYCIRVAPTIAAVPDNCTADDSPENGGVYLIDADAAVPASCYVEPTGDVSMGTYIDTGLMPGDKRHYENRGDYPTGGRFSDNSRVRGIRHGGGYHRRRRKARRTPGLTAVPNVNDSTLIYWYSPEDNGGTAITGYRVEVKEDDGRWPDASATDTRGGTGDYD